ncbi:hypothetical protein ARMGADRAFT_1086690 [Armillaria gallica]|uniref:Uncharacterized protein n=1 Tax=Armillaria gallica TaxID=47427 RepID=A0A2H3CT61_ARMGA|nr:hypothetical protein ARMGADRAFT_1086690 [Armillaria gallica]
MTVECGTVETGLPANRPMLRLKATVPENTRSKQPRSSLLNIAQPDEPNTPGWELLQGADQYEEERHFRQELIAAGLASRLVSFHFVDLDSYRRFIQDKDTSPVDARITLVQRMGNLEVDRLSSLMVEAMAEGKPTPVQEDGGRKGRQWQETSIPLCI